MRFIHHAGSDGFRLLTPINYPAWMFPRQEFRFCTAHAALCGIAVALSLASAPLHAGTATPDRGAAVDTTSAISETIEAPAISASERLPARVRDPGDHRAGDRSDEAAG
jgi:hypothetical protein